MEANDLKPTSFMSTDASEVRVKFFIKDALTLSGVSQKSSFSRQVSRFLLLFLNIWDNYFINTFQYYIEKFC